MTKLKEKIILLFRGNGISAKLFHLIAICWTGVLFHYALEMTGRNLYGVYEYVTVFNEFITKNIIRFGIGFGAIWGVGLLYDKFLRKVPQWVFPLVVCILSGIVSVVWVSLSKTAPVGDQAMVLGCATEYNGGQRFMLEKGAYMSVYAQNLGIMTLERVLVFFFGYNPYLQFQYMAALLVPAGVLSGYHVTGYVSGHNHKAQFYYLILMLTCFPMYGYVPYVYGEILGVIASLGTAWCLLSCFEKFSVLKVILTGILAGMAVQLKTNTLVLMIGIMIVILIKLIREKDRVKYLLTGISLLFGILAFRYGILALYPIPDDAPPIPAMTYIYMGMNDENGNPGWYDSSGLLIFVENGWDVTATNRECRERMQSFIENFRNNPSYFADFVRRKIVMQWEVPMYQCLEMTRQEWYAPIGKLASQIFTETGVGKWISAYMKYYQLLLYGGILGMLLKEWKKDWPIERYILLIGAFGGFLFSLIWEAKPRYVFLYFMMLIPYMAVSYGTFFKSEQKKG